MNYTQIIKELKERGSNAGVESDFDKIIAYDKTLFEKLHRNKLKKEDREMLADALQILCDLKNL